MCRLRGDVKYARHILISLPPYSKSPATAKNYLAEIQAAVSLPQDLLRVYQGDEKCTTSTGTCTGSGEQGEHGVSLQKESHLLLISSTSVYGAPPADKNLVVTEMSPLADVSNREYKTAMR